MKGNLQRVISFILILTFMFTAAVPTIFAEQPRAYDGSQSDWAQAELDQAYSIDLTYDAILSRFKTQITREEFSTLAVLLYQQLTGKLAEFTKNPFSDTTNPNVLKAFQLGIVKGTSATTFTPNNKISRQEICTMLMRTLTASSIPLEFDASAPFVFTDQKAIEPWAKSNIIIAFQYGIIKGLSATNIGPKDFTTREQAILMVKRTYEKIKGKLPVVSDNTSQLPTSPAIVASVPAIVTSVPSVVVAVTQEALTYNGKLIDQTTIAIPPKQSDLANYEANKGYGGFDPVYDEQVSLFVSTTAEQPSQLPLAQNGFQTVVAANHIQNIVKTQPLYLGGWASVYAYEKPVSVYSNQDGSTFVNTKGNMLRWFAYQTKSIIPPAKIIWQVSYAPFTGGRDNWQSPAGLLTSGEVAGNAGGFQIDFAQVYPLYKQLLPPNAYLPEQQYFYVRAISLSNTGTVYGDPSEGLAVVIGTAQPSLSSQTTPIQTSLDLMTPQSGIGTNIGEFKDLPELRPNGVFQTPSDNTNYRVFTFKDLPKNVTDIVIQVSDKPFDPLTSQWPNGGSILYENQVSLPTKTWSQVSSFSLHDTNYPASIAVPFSAFAKPKSELADGQYTYYYVRGVALASDGEPGTVTPTYSDPIQVTYGYTNKIEFWYNPPMDNVIKVNAVHPSVEIVNYVPPKPAAPDALNHYVVFHTPINVNDITAPIISDRGLILPFYTYKNYYFDQGIYSEYDYITKVISKILPPGAKVYFAPPVKKDKPWYDEIIDGVIGFFEDLVSISKTIVNQVTSAYNGIKNQLVNFCVNLCPIDALKGPFKLALEAAINSGMIACGLPPTLPNFDELLQGNINYLARAALSEAGLPANALTDELINKVSAELTEELSQAARFPSPNPLQLKFLKLDPDYSYQPGYIDIQVNNPSPTYNSVRGHLNLDITFEVNPSNREQLSITNTISTGAVDGLKDYADYMKHFLGDLNNNSVKPGSNIVYEAFKPIKGYSIPTLLPKESQTLRLYLTEEVSGLRYNVPKSAFNWMDAYNIHIKNGNGKNHFTFFNMECRYMPAHEYFYIDQGIFADTNNYDYWYQDTVWDSSGSSYKKSNHDIQIRLDKPINLPWTN